MNELTNLTNKIASCDRNAVTVNIMAFCRAITPQFYKAMDDADVAAERLSITVLTQSIEPEQLARMFQVAVEHYPTARSQN